MGFIDSYKRLEKLCSEIYDTNHGVSAYIEEMENIYDGISFVAMWNEDLKMLKHCRWVRNKIAHEPGCTEKNTCDPGDEEWLAGFYSGMLKGQDPLTTYRKRKMALKQAQKETQEKAQPQKKIQDKAQERPQKQTQKQLEKETQKRSPQPIRKATQKQVSKPTSTRKASSASRNSQPTQSVDDKVLKDGCLTCIIITVVVFVLILVGYFL